MLARIAQFTIRLPKISSRMEKVDEKHLSLLNSNLSTAENMITYLQNEIRQLASTLRKQKEISLLKTYQLENEKLANEISVVKKDLINVQILNGVPQIPVPGDSEESASSVQTSEVNDKKTESIQTSKDNEEANESKPTKVSKPKKPTAPAKDELPIDVGRLDIRVGKILTAQIHPDASQLYVEQIDVGDEISRTVVSGLVRHVTLRELDDRMVVVLCNLKPQKMRGVVSEAMVLCASTDTPESVELLNPPPGAKAGDNITVSGYARNPDLPFMNPKKKIFEKVAEDLLIDENKHATYKGVPWQVEGREGFITVEALTGCHIK